MTGRFKGNVAGGSVSSTKRGMKASFYCSGITLSYFWLSDCRKPAQSQGRVEIRTCGKTGLETGGKTVGEKEGLRMRPHCQLFISY